jgi:hypothetical protein
MNYLFKGRLSGHLCPEYPEVLAGMRVRLYRVERPEVTALAVASPKDSFAILSEAEVSAKAGRLIAEAVSDDQGRFIFELDERQKYAGEPFEIDLRCATVRGAAPDRQPLQCTLTTLQPQWRQTDAGSVATWEYGIPHRHWCAVRARFDAWTICGRVTVCDSTGPVMGVRVLAFDADWIEDDPLGSALTDSSGNFRIDYTGSSFRRTPFSPAINLEWSGGPDLYFRIEAVDGTPLLVEDRSAGRTPARENIGHCHCVKLCIKQAPPTQTPPTQPLFTNVGQYHVDPVYGDFTADGLTTATASEAGYAFTGNIPLIGILPEATSSLAADYRFRVAEYDATGTVLGSIVDLTPAMAEPTIIGKLEYWAWSSLHGAWVIRAADYWVNRPGATVSIAQPVGPALSVSVNQDIGADGWISVPRDNDLAPGGRGRFVPLGNLLHLKTTALTSESQDLTLPAPGTAAGQSVPAGSRSRAHCFKIFFEARDHASHAALPGSNALEKIVCSNTAYRYQRHPSWAGSVVTTTAVVSLDIGELSGPGAGCGKLSDELHALHTVYHPFVGSTRVYLEGNPPLPADTALALAGGEAVSAAGGLLIDISGLAPCAYVLWLEATLDLTSGWGRIPNPTLWDHVAFCKG